VIPDPAPPFEVNASGQIKDRIRQMLDRAAELGVQPEIASTFTGILQHLTTDPREWGDPHWRFHTLQMIQFGGTLHHLRCEYSVHERIPTVVITKIFPLAGNPLYGEGFDP
jgi:hypothetical protein